MPRKMAAVIANLAAGVSGDGAPKLLAGTGKDQKHLIVVATGDKGLAGGFNTNVIRAARERIKGLIAEGKDVRIIAVGRKVRDGLSRLYGDRLVRTFEMSDHKVIGLPAAEPIAALIAEEFEAGNADVVTLFYSRFQSVISQVPTPKQLIPAVVDGDAPPIDLNGATYEYEPSEEEILETLLPRNITTQVLAALYENQASFFAAQMARHGQRHPQRGRPDQRPDAELQPQTPGPDHHRTDRDHRRRRSPLIRSPPCTPEHATHDLPNGTNR